MESFDNSVETSIYLTRRSLSLRHTASKPHGKNGEELQLSRVMCKELLKEIKNITRLKRNIYAYLCIEQKIIIMDVIEIKSDLHSLIDKVNDISILNAIKTLLSKQISETDFWDELPLSVQESAKRGMKQVENGKTRTHEEVMQKHKKWL